jgi:POT family proton-dependent oligopeptide transporter
MWVHREHWNQEFLMSQTAQVPQGGFFGHPRGLATLFFTEMWERFSYYGMRGILILFMVDAMQTGGLGMTDGKAAAIYGLYTAAAYLTALPGGWIGDKLVGARNAVFYGGILIAAGQLTLAFGSTNQIGFYMGLLLVVAGTGMLKPNVSAIVGDLYPEGGARRDAGFSVFYMGINLGAFIGPILCGFLGESIAWKYAFMAAGFGMILGLIQYKVGAGLGDLGKKPSLDAAGKSQANKTLVWTVVGIAVAAGAFYFLQSRGITSLSLEQSVQLTGLLIFGLVVVFFAINLTFGGLTGDEKKRLILIFFLFVGAALFWSGFEQAGSSMNLFAERLTDRVIFGWEAPASWLQAVNPIFIIVMAPVFGWLWLALGDKNPSIPMKFGLGLLLLGIGFLVMAWAAVYATPENGVSPVWLVVTYFVHTSGELCLSPVGLSSITKLSPKRLVGSMMGIWFMGASLGNLIAGLAAAQMENFELTQLFGSVAGIVIGSGILFIIFKAPIHKLTAGVE